MEGLGICTLIVVIVYAIAEVAKKNVAKDDKTRAYLPYAGALIGGLLGIAFFAYDPALIECSNAVEAVLTGIGSGLVATGANQVYKQTNKILHGSFVGIAPGLDEVLEEAEELKKGDYLNEDLTSDADKSENI